MFAQIVFYFVSAADIFGISLNLVAVSLLLIAAGLGALTVWFWISARPEPESLAPLEIMGQREFVQADDESRKQMLNSVRPVPAVEPTAPPVVVPLTQPVVSSIVPVSSEKN